MSGKLIRNILFLFTINLVIKPLWTFGVDIPSQNHLGPVVFGDYASLLSLSLIFQIVLDLGLQTYQSRQVGSNPTSISWLLPNSLIAKGALTFIYFCVLIISSYILNYTAYQIQLLMILGLSQVFNSLMLYLRSSVSSLHYYAVDSALSIVDKLIVLLICGSILYQWIDIPFKVEYLIYGQMAGYLLSGCIALTFVLKKVNINWKAIEPKKVKMILKKSWPYALQILAMALFFRIDIVILQKMTQNSSPEEAGHYWEAFRLLDMMNNFTGILFAGLYFPMVMKFKKNKAELLSITHTGLNLLLPISLSICILTYFFNDEIMGVLYPLHTSSNRLLFIMMLSFPFYCLNYIYSTLLSGLGEIKSQTLHALICALIVIIGNVVFATEYGAEATAIFSALGHILFFTLNYLKVKSTFQLDTLPKNFLQKICGFSVMIILCSYGVAKLNLPILLTIFIIAIISLIALFMIKIIRIKEIMQMLKKNN